MDFTKKIKLSENVYEVHVSLVFESLEDAAKKFDALYAEVLKQNFKLISLEVFGFKALVKLADSFKENLSATAVPTMHVLPLDEESKPVLAGAHFIFLEGGVPKFTCTKNGSKAVLVSEGGQEYYRVLGVNLNKKYKTADECAYANIAELEESLKASNFEFSDLARTWFYNCKILDWYADFNKGRTKFFKERKVFDGLLPASTGIGAPNLKGTLMQSGMIAVKGAAKAGKMYEIESPLQCGAPNYGSSFSRAIEMDFEFSKRIMVSGTASIAPEGKTIYFGDIDKQVDLTMRVIGAILESRGLKFADTHRAIVYCMKPEYYAAFKKWMGANLEIQHIPSYSTVCRSDLMFEVELDAGKNK